MISPAHTTVLALPALLDQAPQQAVTVRAKGQLEVGGLVEVMLELALQRTVEVGLEEVGLHLDLADHAVLVGVEHAERVNEREVLRDLGELVVRDEAVPVVVVVLVHGLDHCVHVLLDGVGVEWGGEALRPGGEGRGARRRGGRAHGGGARLAAQRELSHNQLIIIFPIIIFILLD